MNITFPKSIQDAPFLIYNWGSTGADLEEKKKRKKKKVIYFRIIIKMPILEKALEKNILISV